jgi:muramoyltetrapeptide carboxypeptidase
VAGSVAGATIAGAEAGATGTTGAAGPQGRRRRAQALRPGDRVRIVAPARAPDTRLARGIEILESFGLVVEVAPHVFDTYGYLAATDANRLADLNAAFADPGIRGVFAARGGYGTQRIIDKVDIGPILRDPKVFVGFSDLTTLHLRLQHVGRLASWYGPMINWSDARTGADSVEALRKAIMTTDPVVITRDPAEPSAAVDIPGRAAGILLGGNLTMLDTGVSAPDFPDLSRAILFFEDVDEGPYGYDRMLTHLIRTGALDRVAGVVVGQLTNAVGSPGEWTAAQAISDRLAGLGVPVLGGLRLGHGNGQLTVPFGVPASFDTATGTLTVESGVVPATRPAPPAPQRLRRDPLPAAPADPSTPEW